MKLQNKILSFFFSTMFLASCGRIEAENNQTEDSIANQIQCIDKQKKMIKNDGFDTGDAKKDFANLAEMNDRYFDYLPNCSK